MATRPTRSQQQACDELAQALVLITEAARLDGNAKFGPNELGVLAARLSLVSSAFGLDEIVARALERRGRAMGLPGSTAELLTLLELGVRPLEMLLLDDCEFKTLVQKLLEELGEP